MMNRFAFLLFIVLLSVNSIAQKVIQMENMNGVYRISCSVNGAKMKMIFDTGASTVSLSEPMATFLYDNGYISKEDVLGSSKSTMADGSIHDNVVINIKDIEISGLHIKNVQAVVLSSQNAPLLLGQSAIQKLGRISLNGDKLIINDYEGDYTPEQLTKMFELALKQHEEEHYYSAIDNLTKIVDNLGGLTSYGYYILIDSYFETKQFDKCVKYGKEWDLKFRDDEPTSTTSKILYDISAALAMEGHTAESISYMERCAKIDEELGYPVAFSYTSIAMDYMKLDNFDRAIVNFKKALKDYFAFYNTSEQEINSKGIDNKNIGRCLYFYAFALYNKDEMASGDYIMGLSAKCNFEDAIEHCQKYNIKYKLRQSLFE